MDAELGEQCSHLALPEDIVADSTNPTVRWKHEVLEVSAGSPVGLSCALGVAQSTPGPDFGKSAPAPDTRWGDRIKRAHFVARALNPAHESPRKYGGAR